MASAHDAVHKRLYPVVPDVALAAVLHNAQRLSATCYTFGVRLLYNGSTVTSDDFLIDC